MNLEDYHMAHRLAKLKPSLLLTLVRHGQSEGNKSQVIQGQADYPLSELGRRQAEALKDHLAEKRITFDVVYSSDLSRARATGDVLERGGELTITNDVRLRERCYGVCENLPAVMLHRGAAEAGLKVDDFVPEGGESHEEVSTRGAAFFRELCSRHLSDECTRVLVTSHGCFIRELIRHLFDTYHGNLKRSEAVRISPNTGVTVVHVARKGVDGLSLQFLKMHSDGHLVNVESTAPPPV